MNSLEYIEKEIKQLEERKEKAFKNEYYGVYKECSQKITTLQQIKSELEAWEEIQGTITEGQDSEGKYCFIETIYFTGESGQKIIKALKDDDRR